MSSPSVSIIVPARDPGAYLREAIDSVSAQTHDDWELVVVDDGSSEDLSWVPSSDRRVRLLRTTPQGVSSARNLGIAETTGELVAFLDADDRWHPRKLERQVAAMEPGVPFSYTAFDLVNAAGERTGPGYGGAVGYLDMLRGNLGILQSSVVARREALYRCGLYDPLLTLQEDLDLFLRLARTGDGLYLESVEVDYRQHESNASTAYWEAMHALLDIYRVHEAAARRSGDGAAIAAVHEGRRAVRYTYGWKAIDSARSALHDHRGRDTTVALVRAISASPRAVAVSARRLLIDRSPFSASRARTPGRTPDTPSR